MLNMSTNKSSKSTSLKIGYNVDLNGNPNFGLQAENPHELINTILAPVEKTLKSNLVSAGLGIITDQLIGWRATNQIDICQKIQKKLKLAKQKGYNIQPIEDSKLAYKYVENASLESDPSLQELWVNLAVNKQIGLYDSTVLYYSILSELTNIEVTLLDLIFDEHNNQIIKNANSVNPIISLVFEGIESELKISNENVKKSINILTSKELIASPKDLDLFKSINLSKVVVYSNPGIIMTQLGLDFVKSCKFNI
jgi:hypothetical protein